MTATTNPRVARPLPSKYSVRPLIGAMGLTGTPEAQAAMNVLAKYGTDAHVYIPGVGNPYGVTTGNYQLSTGTDAVTDQPVGLSLDAAGSVGPELVSNGGFDSATGWAYNAGTGTAIISGGVATVNSTDGTFVSVYASPQIAISNGKTYTVSYTVTAASGGGVRIDMGGVTGTARTAPGVYSEFITISNASSALSLVRGGGVSGGSIDNISVREVTGIHASQTTSGFRPVLRANGSNKWYWQFDGTDDRLSLGSVPFQMSDDHAVVAGFVWSGGGSVNKTVVEPAGTSSTAAARAAQLGIENGTNKLQAQWVDDAVNVVAIKDSTAALSGTSYVLSAKAIGTSLTARKNGVQFGSGSKPTGATTLTGATIASRGTTTNEFFQGNIYAVIAIKGTVSDADLKILEKWVGQLSGVTIV